MERITIEMINKQVGIINGLIGGDHSYNKAYGKYRLYRQGGSVELSPRVSKRELYQILSAYKYGILSERFDYVGTHQHLRPSFKKTRWNINHSEEIGRSKHQLAIGVNG